MYIYIEKESTPTKFHDCQDSLLSCRVALSGRAGVNDPKLSAASLPGLF